MPQFQALASSTVLQQLATLLYLTSRQPTSSEADAAALRTAISSVLRTALEKLTVFPQIPEQESIYMPYLRRTTKNPHVDAACAFVKLCVGCGEIPIALCAVDLWTDMSGLDIETANSLQGLFYEVASNFGST